MIVISTTLDDDNSNVDEDDDVGNAIIFIICT